MEPAQSAASSMSSAQFVTWGVTAAGTLASLVWNYINFRAQKAARSEAVRLDEFKRLRNGMDIFIERANETLSSLEALAKSTPENWQAEITVLEKGLTTAYIAVGRVLTRAADSEFASGQDWDGLLDNSWDSYVASIDPLYNPNKSLEERQKLAAFAASKLGDMLDVLEKRISTEMLTHT